MTICINFPSDGRDIIHLVSSAMLIVSRCDSCKYLAGLEVCLQRVDTRWWWSSSGAGGGENFRAGGHTGASPPSPW